MGSFGIERAGLSREFKESEWPDRFISDNETERRPATPEERERMDRELTALSTLLNSAGVWWQLDGSLNLSVRNGDYVGVHRDIDVSLLKQEVPALASYLEAHGCGLFFYKKVVSEDAGKVRTLMAATLPDFLEGMPGWQRRIAPVDAEGRAITSGNLPPVESSFIEEDAVGCFHGSDGVTFPARWMEGETREFHGSNFNLSNPARFLFYKLFKFRGTDDADLRTAVSIGMLSPQDLDEVEKTITPILEQMTQDGNGEKSKRIEERIANIRRAVETKAP
jgi:hypothetical protein